mgnify:CR=1 FL=1
MIFPVFNNQFKIGTKGLASTQEDMKSISNLESFSVSFDNGVEEFSPMEAQGWKRRLLTAKSFSISLNGKRDVGDVGNDYVASMYFVTGTAAYTKFEWTMIDGTKVAFNCVVNCTAAGGDSTAIDALEFEVLSDGKPEVTPATATEE